MAGLRSGFSRSTPFQSAGQIAGVFLFMAVLPWHNSGIELKVRFRNAVTGIAIDGRRTESEGGESFPRRADECVLRRTGSKGT